MNRSISYLLASGVIVSAGCCPPPSWQTDETVVTLASAGPVADEVAAPGDDETASEPSDGTDDVPTPPEPAETEPVQEPVETAVVPVPLDPSALAGADGGVAHADAATVQATGEAPPVPDAAAARRERARERAQARARERAEQAAAQGSITGRVATGRAGSVVYIEHAATGTSPRAATMDQRGMRFAPRVLPVVAGSTVRFLNNDPTPHSVFTPDGEGYDLGQFPQGAAGTHTFPREGVYTQLCRLHPQMIAYVVVLQNRYFGVTGSGGSFRIEGVPPGNYQLRVWNERGGGGTASVTVRAGEPAEVTVP